MEGKRYLCVFLFVFAVFTDLSQGDVGYTVSPATNYKVLKTSQQSTLYEVITQQPNAYGDWPVYLADLHGSRFQMGYDYGVMTADWLPESYDQLVKYLIGNSLVDEALIWAINQAVDWQWDSFLSIETPSEYLEEISGIAAGGNSVGVSDLDKYITRTIVFANVPGSPKDYIYVLLAEWNATHLAHLETLPSFNKIFKRDQSEPIQGLQCSMFAVWGSRTKDGSLMSARNLDWNRDTGMQKYKMITIYHPDDGKYAHATLGFAGMWGALTGMSSKGLTVHEANLEEKFDTFIGFPWVLRLRYLMENAVTIAEGHALWVATNNTAGFNHMFGSGSDAKAMVAETMQGYTAFFLDNDPREQSAYWINDTSNQKVPIGFPLKDAVYRTNHGYDPIIRQNYLWSQSPTSWSMQRYMMLYNGFSWYEQSNTFVDELAAVNMTAIVADKGHTAYQCQPAPSPGSNVLSATYHPSNNVLYAAWEYGTGQTWKPACCATYVRFDMNKWW